MSDNALFELIQYKKTVIISEGYSISKMPAQPVQTKSELIPITMN